MDHDEDHTLTEDEIRQGYVIWKSNSQWYCNRFNISQQRVTSMIRNYQEERGILSREDEDFILETIIKE